MCIVIPGKLFVISRKFSDFQQMFILGCLVTSSPNDLIQHIIHYEIIIAIIYKRDGKLYHNMPIQ